MIKLMLLVHAALIVMVNGASYDVKLQDNCAPNTNVLDLTNLLNQHGVIRPSDLKYSLSRKYKASEYFEIRNGKLFTRTIINIDKMCSAINECCNKSVDYCDFNVAFIYTINSMTNIRDLRIHINDINDHSPQFEDTFFDVRLSESKRDPHFVNLPLASDADFGRNRIQNYEISVKEPNSFDDYFTLVITKDLSVPSQVGLKLNRNLDRETIGEFSFQLLAIDGGIPTQKTGTLSVKIYILDENDNSPIFERSLYRKSIREGFFNDLPILVLSATDIDDGENAKILFRFAPRFSTDSSVTNKFKIDSSSGSIYLKESLDYEKEKFYRFNVIATNPTPFVNNTLHPSTTTVEIEVENVDDEPLQIIVDYPGEKNWSQVPENSRGVFVAFITVRSMESGRKTYGIECSLQMYDKIFELMPKVSDDDSSTKSFEVRTSVGIDRELNPRLETVVVCKESNGQNDKYFEAPFVVVILDENDNAPSLTVEGHTVVKENEMIGKVIFVVKATDPDKGENGTVKFSLDKSSASSREYFTIGEMDGKVRVKSLIDCEITISPLTFLDLVVTGIDHGTPPRSTDLSIHVLVKDVNDNVPTFVTRPLQFSIVENSPPFTLVGEIEIQDKDNSDRVTLRLVHNNRQVIPFIISTKDHRLFYLNTTQSIDRERDSMFKFHVVASDGSNEAAHSVTETVEVKILDLNDNPPSIIFPIENNASVHRISYFEPVHYKFILVSANDQDQMPDNGRLEYSIEEEEHDLKLFAISGEDTFISTQRLMTSQDLGEHKIKVIVRDCGMPPLEASVRINVVIDQSTPKSGPLPDNGRHLRGQPTRPTAFSSDVILYVTVVVIISVVVIVVVIVVYFLRRCKRTDSNLYNVLTSCCRLFRPSNHDSKSALSLQPSMSHLNENKHFYHTHQLPLINNENQFDDRVDSERWNMENSQSPSYNVVTDRHFTSINPYAKLNNGTTFYHPLHMPHHYQTIEDGRLGSMTGDGTMVHPPSDQLRRPEQYRSEVNLKKWNFMGSEAHAMCSGDRPLPVPWITSRTPLPTRSRTMTSAIGVDEQQNFAVAYPRDQSTFV